MLYFLFTLNFANKKPKNKKQKPKNKTKKQKQKFAKKILSMLIQIENIEE
jgi:uncharacterized Rossmann fold enzyme